MSPWSTRVAAPSTRQAESPVRQHPLRWFVDYYDQLKSTIPLDALIVCYCESVTCDNSENLVRELGLMGYTNVLVYRGGWEEWVAAGNPVDGTPDN